MTNEGKEVVRYTDDWGPLEWPGNLHVVSSRGTVFTGIKVVYFYGEGMALAESMNTFFAGIGRGCLYLREVVYQHGMLVYYTKKVSDEKMEIIADLQLKIDEMVDEVMKQRAVAADAEELARIADEETRRELILAGQNCLKNHGALIKEARKAKKEKR